MGNWQVGFAAVDITPGVGATLAGFVARVLPAAGVHDPLYAKCVVVGDGTTLVGLLILDLIGADSELVSEIRRKVKALPSEHLAVLATHTHGGPSVLRRGLLGQVDNDYLSWVAQQAATAVETAVKDMQVGKVVFGKGQEPFIAKNRRDAHGLIDSEVPVVRFEDLKGKVRGLLVSYACHPVTLGADNLLITRDYPGEVVTLLEQLYPNATVLFAAGCCGQLNTGHSAEDSVTGRSSERRSFAEAQRIGRALAGAALQVSEQIASPFGKAEASPSPRLRVLTRTVSLPFCREAKANQDQAESWRAELMRLCARGGAPGEIARLETFLTWHEKFEGNAIAQEEVVELMALALDDVVLLIFPGEVFVEFGLEAKARFPNAHLVTLAYGNGAPGYIPYVTAYPQGGYEVTEAYRFYGFPAAFDPRTSDILLETATELVQEILA